MCNRGVEAQVLFLKRSGKRQKRGRGAPLRQANISQIPVEPAPPACDQRALHSWGAEGAGSLEPAPRGAGGIPATRARLPCE